MDHGPSMEEGLADPQPVVNGGDLTEWSYNIHWGGATFEMGD